MQRAIYLAIAASVFTGSVPTARGQDANSVLQKLKSQFTLTQISADKNDIARFRDLERRQYIGHECE